MASHYITKEGFARLDHSGSGVIVLFRNHSDAAEAVVHLPLIPPGKYKLRSVLNEKDLGVFEHADWARGVQVAFATSASVEALQVAAMRG